PAACSSGTMPTPAARRTHGPSIRATGLSKGSNTSSPSGIAPGDGFRPLLLPRERLGDQLARVGHAVKRDEAAHTRALARAEQGLVERAKPVAKGSETERLPLADLVDLGLDLFGRGTFGHRLEHGIERAQRIRFAGIGRA